MNIRKQMKNVSVKFWLPSNERDIVIAPKYENHPAAAPVPCIRYLGSPRRPRQRKNLNRLAQKTAKRVTNRDWNKYRRCMKTRTERISFQTIDLMMNLTWSRSHMRSTVSFFYQIISTDFMNSSKDFPLVSLFLLAAKEKKDFDYGTGVEWQYLCHTMTMKTKLSDQLGCRQTYLMALSNLTDWCISLSFFPLPSHRWPSGFVTRKSCWIYLIFAAYKF